MARDHDRNWVGAIGEAHGSGCFGIPDSVSQFPVGDSFSIGNIAKAAPNSQLERRSLGRELQVEAFQFSPEIGLELLDRTAERSAIFFPERFRLGRVTSVHET